MAIRILIADDNWTLRRTLRKLLESNSQWEISDAADGKEAVSRALELRPNLVILDLAMPVMDGLSAAREISRVLPETPILMCTMHISSQLELEAQKAGVRKVLSKADSSLLLPVAKQILESQPPAAWSPAPDPQPSLVLPPPDPASVPSQKNGTENTPLPANGTANGDA